MNLNKKSVVVAVSILSLVVGLGTASAQGRGGGPGGGGGGGGGGRGGPGPGGPGGGGPGPGGPGHGGGPGGPVYGGPGPGRPVYGPGGRYYRYPYYGYGFYGYPYGWYGYPYVGFGWGWPYGPYPYYGYGYPYGAVYDGSASIRLDVTPKQAEVYVDGYYAGTVDDFDGSFQRLRVPPGGRELTLYCDGFKTVHQSLQLSPGSTFKVTYKMEALAPGEVAEPRPTPPPQPEENEGAPPGPPESRYAPPRGAAGFGTLAIRVQPGDAIVLIDGERWQTSPDADRLVVQVGQGPHRIEIRKDGFDTYSTDVTMEQGQTLPLNVSLRRR